MAPHRSDRGDITQLESGDASSVASLYMKSSNPQPVESAVAEENVTIGGHRVRYLRSCSGPALLLVHGLMGYSFSWRFTIPALARHFTVYAPDLLGIGFSDRVSGLDCSMRASAQRMMDFLDAIGVRDFDLVGTSHGGALATIMAASAGKRVQRLALVAPANPWSRTGRRRIFVLSRTPGSWVLRSMFMRIPAVSRWMLNRLYADPSRISPGTLEGYAAPLRIAGSVDYLLAVIGCWHHDLRQLKAEYEKIHVPTLLVWGDRDPAVLPSSALPLQRAIRGSQLVMIPGVGHLPYEEWPEEFNRVLLEFFSRR